MSMRRANLLINMQPDRVVCCRYDHFKDKPATLLLKMVQFVTVILNDDQNKFNDVVVERSST